MTPEQKKNLERLLAPRHAAFIGGRDAAVAIAECKRAGFKGEIWPVNPKRETLEGYPCFVSVDDLPEAPDAVFLAVPALGTIDVIDSLRRRGSGGIVCYSAGFAETGEEGLSEQKRLIEAAGDMALIGPNCYGMINYLDHFALWPFAHGGECPGYGAAIVTQSGMLSSDLTMSQRSMPFTHMISAGNQAVLQLEDFVDLLCERDEVRAIGMHIEGLRDVQHFSRVALKALEHKTPLVVLKTGTSEVGSQLTVSHTGSLSGADDLYQALFDRLGIIRVTNPSQLLETLKFLCTSGVPEGRRVMGFTCSGGGATMLADYGETVGLKFPQPDASKTERLVDLLPDIATVSNPLDYTTPIWGNAERVLPVFETACLTGSDAAILVQDYPLPGLDESKPYYFSDTQSFVAATRKAGIPGAICCTLPENMDQETRDYLVREGVTPLQGIHEALNAIASASWYGERRAEILSNKPGPLFAGRGSDATLLDEWQGKRMLAEAGLTVPEGCLVHRNDAVSVADDMGYPLVLKMVSSKLAHKTEAGAVQLNLQSGDAVLAAIEQMRDNVERFNPEALSDQFLIEKMVLGAVGELMVSIRSDPQFGLAMTLAGGGIFVELLDDAETLLLPASESEIETALKRLKISKLFDGFRGKAVVDTKVIVQSLHALGDFVQSQADRITEVEINPMFVLADGLCAVDVLMQVRKDDHSSAM